jgi:septal ring factor EnvC (AmiA/AmiB activator)
MRLPLCLCALGVILTGMAGLAHVQAQAQAQEKPAPEAAPVPVDALIEKRQYELRGVEDTLRLSDEQRQKLQSEIAGLRAEHERLSASLIALTRKTQDTEIRIATIESRLDMAQASAEAIRRSLDGRREVIAAVLAALQRMGRHAPPAVLISPQDMLRAVRSSMLLGAVVPQLRADAEALASDLANLVHVNEVMASERIALQASRADLAREQASLSVLIEERGLERGSAERALGAENSRAGDLARQAADLKDLIARLEQQAGKTSTPEAEAARLGPAVAFARTRGTLHLPVIGALMRAYGAADDYGGTEKGLSIAARPGAVVAAPADGRVVFAGPWRSYGQLLVLNAGEGYHIILAGMGRLHVQPGQFVLAGEPVAHMGEGKERTTTTISVGAGQPVLYVEFRKDGIAIDPAPWWARSDIEKVRG